MVSSAGGLATADARVTVVSLPTWGSEGEVTRPANQNDLLFKRDRYICAYCGEQFRKQDLTRDHIVPRSRGGRDVWENCASCCRRCNQEKGAKTPTEWGHELLYIPYAPSRFEHFILAARKGIKADQMQFLMAKVPKHSRMHLS